MKYSPTNQNVAWFRDRFNEGLLDLKPPFQRKPVWAVKQKQFLIESVLLGLPIPELYLQNELDEDERVHFYVVDGQQRIRALLQFLGVDTTESEQEDNRFVLDKLESNSSFRGKSYKDLTKAEQTSLLTYQFAVRQLEGATDDNVRDIFKRFNKYVTKLNDQEMRNATYIGPFIQLANKLADNEYWIANSLVSPAQIRRMKDIEFVSELLIGILHGPQGGSAKIIDEYYSQYEDYDDDFPGMVSAEKKYLATLELIKAIFSETLDGRFRSNRTDFYTLFVALNFLLIDHILSPSSLPKLRKTLREFEIDADKRVADESVSVCKNVAAYVRAVQRGANDKARRAERHSALIAQIQKHFSKLP